MKTYRRICNLLPSVVLALAAVPASAQYRPALKTNLLMDIPLALNAEVEMPVPGRWSVAAGAVFPWWLWQDRRNCMQLMAGTVEVRKWFGWFPGRHFTLTGWFAGMSAGAGYYDLERRGKGWQGEFILAPELSIGFAHPLCCCDSRWRVEFAIGAGVLRTRYREYRQMRGPDNKWHLIRQHGGTYTWFGPTRAEVSLVWMPGRKGDGKR